MANYTSSSPEETESIAADWIKQIDPGSNILLEGDLGAGKTCFVRGAIQGLGGNPDLVSSPSFGLVNHYSTGSASVFHWDLYRLTPETDWSVLDLEDHLHDSSALCFVEWPKRYTQAWPPPQYTVSLIDQSERGREIQIR
ncbi:MAG: tRNA (adenosine(37)-N6)-threonylcarbamoyltransferase complex ATPase subunit type 1 TsaE [Verrucomicrobiota bacterium]